MMKVKWTGIDCDRCKEPSFDLVNEICTACGSGMNLWGDNSNE